MENLKISNAIKAATEEMNRWKKEEDEINKMIAPSFITKLEITLEELSSLQTELSKNSGDEECNKKTLKGYVRLMQIENFEAFSQLSIISSEKEERTKEEILKLVNEATSRVAKVQKMILALCYLVDDQPILPN